MKFSNSQIALGIFCGIILFGQMFNILTRAKLPDLVHDYTFHDCPISVKLPNHPSLNEDGNIEKITTTAEGYLYRVSCLHLGELNNSNISLEPIVILEMFNLDEIKEITDTNFELSGLANGPFFYYEYLGTHKKSPIKSLGAIYFKQTFLVNIELITFDPKQDNIYPN